MRNSKKWRSTKSQSGAIPNPYYLDSFFLVCRRWILKKELNANLPLISMEVEKNDRKQNK
jgi:hypothetical protein